MGRRRGSATRIRGGFSGGGIGNSSCRESGEVIVVDQSAGTRALVELARAVAGQNRAALAKLDRIRWNLARQPRWIKPVIAALTLAMRFKAMDRARGWLAALPESWDELRQNLLELVDP